MEFRDEYAYRAHFQNLAAECACGDADAMLELSAMHRGQDPRGQSPEADLWLLRAAMYGQPQAQRTLRERMLEQPRFLESLPIPYQNFLPGKRARHYTGFYSGAELNALGFLVFRPAGRYLLAGIDRNRAMIVREFADRDSPDEDGFGEEIYYNYFCLDEFFRSIPGVPEARNLSSQECRDSAEYGAMVKAMVKAMEKEARCGKLPALWTEFLPEKSGAAGSRRF
ncbi:MAG: hypothetical protein NC399_00710 [Muribaculum sp.]|nr:hypothetical protein [Muribaculum sp.]